MLRIEVPAAMPKSDEGHYELVLGNRQLLSGFFVLVILFAIFLTLGYILGRNSAVMSEPKTVAGAAGKVSPGTADDEIPQSANLAGRPAASESGPEPMSPATAVLPQAPPATPVQSAPAEKREIAPAAAAPVPAPQHTATAERTGTTERTREILSEKIRIITPRKGDVFLQVAAIGRAEAELMAEQLNKRGYRAFLSEVPDKNLFRVLIGPFETSARLNETKKKLSGDGLPSIVQRY